MQNHFRFIAVASILLMELMYTQITFAATENSNQEAVVVTATRFETSIETAPVNITVISADDIRKSSASNLPQALETLGGMYIKDLFGPAGSKASVDMGGFGSSGMSNTLILLNGRRLNDADLSGVNLDAIPLGAIEKIEIVRGNATVLYGDNATAGAINIVTKSGFDDNAMKLRIDAGTHNTQGAQVIYSGSSDGVAALVSVNAQTSDGYRDNNASDKKNALADFSMSTKDSVYGLRIISSDEELELPGSLDEATYIEDPTASNPSIEFINEDRTTVELYLQHEKYAAELGYRSRNQNSFLFGDVSSDLETLSFTPRYTTQLQKHTLVAGVDLYNSQLNINSDFSAFASLNKSDTERKSVAIYVSDTVSLSNVTSLNVGMRRQQVKVDITNSDITLGVDSDDGRQDILNAWDLTLSHKFNSDIKTYIRYAEGMRFPVLDEMWGYFDGNINLLDPQTSSHIEAGLNLKINPVNLLSVNIFQIDIKDEIGFDAATFSNLNFDDTTHKGLDVNYQSVFTSWWALTATVNWRQASFTDGPYKGNDIPEIPKFRAAINQSIDISSEQHIGIDIVYTGPRYFGDDFTNQGKRMGGYSTFNAQYRKNIGEWFFMLKANNLTNKKAADYGLYNPFAPNPYFYYPLPERTILLSIGATII